MISETAFREAAQRLGCEVAAIKAVAKVEANGGGFDKDGMPKILFEAHHFSRLTGKKYNASYPAISSTSWNRSLYARSNLGEHKRLALAADIDRDAALKSASWGMFQILGSNWKVCGYDSLQDFINAMYVSEDKHLEAFCGFVEGNKLTDFLRTKNWAKFAARYNGPSYRANKYDEKMAAAYREFS